MDFNQEQPQPSRAGHPDSRREAGRPDRRGEGPGGGFNIASLLDGKPDGQLLFVGAVSCTRHRGFQMGNLMREGRMAILCPSAVDFASGRYLHQIVDAIVELSQERGSKQFVLMYGCQCALLSTDFALLGQELKDEHGIELSIHEHCHLCPSEEDKLRIGGKGGRA